MSEKAAAIGGGLVGAVHGQWRSFDSARSSGGEAGALVDQRRSGA